MALTAVLMAKAKADTSFDQAPALNEAAQYQEAFPLMKEAAEAGNVLPGCQIDSVRINFAPPHGLMRRSQTGAGNKFF